MASILSVRNLRKSYGEHEVVSGVSLTVESGQCFGLLGPNGAGKTTTLRLCLGLTEPNSSEIELAGEPTGTRARRALASTWCRNGQSGPDFTVGGLLVYGRYWHEGKEIRARIRSYELPNSPGAARRAFRRLRRHEAAPHACTRARNDPDIIFMDEPTTGLDPQARHLIWERLKRLLALGKTILLTTHFMDEAERLCHRLAIMDRGRIIAEGSPRELIEQHIEPEVVEVYGEGVTEWGTRAARDSASRVERSGETVFCYTADARPLLAQLETERGLRYLHRPANLNVFAN
jgi:lipooligosaccharide transport system ATP-binding protein